MRYGVWATPPVKGFWAGLQPRFQMWNTGEIVAYETAEDAQAYCDICMEEHTRTWTYEVRPLP